MGYKVQYLILFDEIKSKDISLGREIWHPNKN